MSETDKLAKTVHGVLRIAVVFLIVAGILMYFTPIGMDDSDTSPAERSGMSVYRDARTGCQYLGTRGALTPRLDGSGKQIGCFR